MTNNDTFFIKHALSLAKRGQSWTRPNPLVGAVIVENGKIIGQGFHRKYGAHHAEVDALQSMQDKGFSAQGATLFVTLEPCCHVGKTPPCVEAIIQSGIKKVVCSVLDPNPLVSGKSVEILRQHGIEVVVGVGETEARQLNEGFFSYHVNKRPFVVAKFAASLDGKIATQTGDSKWITNEKSRAYARRLRAQYDAILVGKNTVIKDNPHLGCRSAKLQDPLRVIIDSELSLPIDAQVFRDVNVLVFSSQKADPQRIKLFEQRGVEVVLLPDKIISVQYILKELYKRDIQSVLVEGGSQTLGYFFDQKVVDKVYAFHAPLVIGGSAAPSAVGGHGFENIASSLKLKKIKRKFFGDDMLTCGYTS